MRYGAKMNLRGFKIIGMIVEIILSKEKKEKNNGSELCKAGSSRECAAPTVPLPVQAAVHPQATAARKPQTEEEMVVLFAAANQILIRFDVGHHRLQLGFSYPRPLRYINQLGRGG